MRYQFGGLIFGGAYTWRGLFSEFYGSNCFSRLICNKNLLERTRIFPRYP